MSTPPRFSRWPAADRAMWDALVKDGGVLDDAGAGAHWRPATRYLLSRDYGYWLAYLSGRGEDIHVGTPIGRLTADRVSGYAQAIQHLAFSTRAARLRSLLLIARRVAPSMNWHWLQRIHAPLDAEARRRRGERKQGRVIATHRLLEAGLRHMDSAQCAAGIQPRQRALMFRDGLAVALLALRPLRNGNFGGLSLGLHVKSVGAGYQITIPGSETKNGRPIETAVPGQLEPYFREYLTVHRPILLGEHQSDYVWITVTGRPFTIRHLWWRVSLTTRRQIGVAVPPHLFRDSAATTIATADPGHVRMIAPLLGHATQTTAERYYNQARSLEAGRAHQFNLREIRRGFARRSL